MERNNVIWILELIRERESKTLAERDALNLAIEALEKQIPMRYLEKDENSCVANKRCPRCKEAIFTADEAWKIKYCKECGQALDWSKDENTNRNRLRLN